MGCRGPDPLVRVGRHHIQVALHQQPAPGRVGAPRSRPPGWCVPAADNGIGRSTCYDYLHEGIDVLAAQSPSLHNALLATQAAGYSHINIDGTLIETDRVSTPGPTEGVDLWWSGNCATRRCHFGWR